MFYDTIKAEKQSSREQNTFFMFLLFNGRSFITVLVASYFWHKKLTLHLTPTGSLAMIPLLICDSNQSALHNL